MKNLHCLSLAALALVTLATGTQAQSGASSQLSALAASGLGACDRTTAAAATGCASEASADLSYALGACENEPVLAAKQTCQTRATNAFNEARDLCLSQASARNAVCNAIGQLPYDPAFAPADFSVNFTNPLFPLKVGSVWLYRNGPSEVTVTVTPNTRKLGGVTTRVVHDVNRVSGVIEEDTFDYYAQRKDGNVWYFGEDTIKYDNGIADTTGSWRTGTGGAKPGILMFAHPVLNKTYRQEFNLGTAEDMARPLLFGQHVSVPFGTFNNALKTREFTAIEPGRAEFKFYLPNVGNVLTIDSDTAEHEGLVTYTPGP